MDSGSIVKAYNKLYYEFSWPKVSDESEYLYIGPAHYRKHDIITENINRFEADFFYFVLDRKMSVKIAVNNKIINDLFNEYESFALVDISFQICIEVSNEVMRIGFR